MRVVNLKNGSPTVEQALRRLDMELQTARMQGGVKLVRVIHGYGSSGKGGAIGAAVGRHLRGLQSRGLVKSFVAGADWPDGPGARQMLNRQPQLRDSLRADAGNEGITFVEV